MRRWIGFSFAGLLATLAMAAGPAGARAGLVVVRGTTIPVGDPQWEVDYTVKLQAGTELLQNDFFTVYDIPGVDLSAPTLHSEPLAYPDFVFSVHQTGLTPSGVTVTDGPLYNATWKYLGTSPIAALGSDLVLGIFSLVTTVSLPDPPIGTYQFAAQTHLISNPTNPTGNSGDFQVTLNGVPEPSSVVLMGLGAMGLGLVLRRRAAG